MGPIPLTTRRAASEVRVQPASTRMPAAAPASTRGQTASYSNFEQAIERDWDVPAFQRRGQ
ncbi:MAG: hypothetical protein HOO96_00400 [Polyangiaceae bacterium]|nr:hypothetical protein [Polyangiaceae bacterium]